jgi:N-acetyltransferase 10
VQSLSISESALAPSKSAPSTTSTAPITPSDLSTHFSPFDLARLDSYANNMLDYHVILDLLPPIAQLYFTTRLPAVSLSGVQQSILLSIGLQRKDLSAVSSELGVPSSQLLAIFVKVMRKFSVAFATLLKEGVAEGLPSKKSDNLNTDANGLGESRVAGSVDVHSNRVSSKIVPEITDDGDEDEETKQLREKQRAMIDALPLDKYDLDAKKNGKAKDEDDEDWKAAEKAAREGGGGSKRKRDGKEREKGHRKEHRREEKKAKHAKG